MDNMTSPFVTLFVTFCLYLAVTVVPSEAGDWSEWRNVTSCNAKPCGCWGDKKPCKTGTKIQMRVCEFDGITGCQFDGDGSMRQTDCEMHICPGWSEFTAKPDASCYCKANETNGTRPIVRQCDNPPPVHPDVKCRLSTRNKQAMTEEGEEECECDEEVEEQTTVAEWTDPPTTPKPHKCCEENVDYYDQDASQEQGATTAAPDDSGTTDRPAVTYSQAVQDYMDEFYDDDDGAGDDYGGDDYDADCVPCDDDGNPVEATTAAAGGTTPVGGFEATTAGMVGDVDDQEYGDYDSEEDPDDQDYD